MNRSRQAGMVTKTVVALLVGLALASVRWRQEGRVHGAGLAPALWTSA
jgi:hypothetical protein